MEGLCVNLIFGTRGEAWIYSDHPTGALSIAVSLSVRPHFTHILCVPFPYYDIIFVNNDALSCISALKRCCDFRCPISPLYAGTEFQA